MTDKALHAWTMRAARNECGWVCCDCGVAFEGGMPDACICGHLDCNEIIRSDKAEANSTLGERLAKARAAKGWSLSEAAGRLGTTKGHLHDMEKGRSINPTLSTIVAMVRVYGLTPEEIVACGQVFEQQATNRHTAH